MIRSSALFVKLSRAKEENCSHRLPITSGLTFVDKIGLLSFKRSIFTFCGYDNMVLRCGSFFLCSLFLSGICSSRRAKRTVKFLVIYRANKMKSNTYRLRTIGQPQFIGIAPVTRWAVLSALSAYRRGAEHFAVMQPRQPKHNNRCAF